MSRGVVVFIGGKPTFGFHLKVALIVLFALADREQVKILEAYLTFDWFSRATAESKSRLLTEQWAGTYEEIMVVWQRT
jgi:hypothetical protein